jgi:hypothetical protein
MDPKARASLGSVGRLPEEALDLSCAKVEKELKNQICSMFLRSNIWFRRSRMDKPTTDQKGTPDFIFAIGGRALAFECKVEGRKLSDDQRVVRAAMEKDGWCYWIITSYMQALDVVNALMSAKDKENT